MYRGTKRYLWAFIIVIYLYQNELGHSRVSHPFHHLLPVLGIFGEDLIFEFFMGVWLAG
jgi:hypothetical protein